MAGYLPTIQNHSVLVWNHQWVPLRTHPPTDLPDPFRLIWNSTYFRVKGWFPCVFLVPKEILTTYDYIMSSWHSWYWQEPICRLQKVSVGSCGYTLVVFYPYAYWLYQVLFTLLIYLVITTVDHHLVTTSNDLFILLVYQVDHLKPLLRRSIPGHAMLTRHHTSHVGSSQKEPPGSEPDSWGLTGPPSAVVSQHLGSWGDMAMGQY